MAIGNEVIVMTQLEVSELRQEQAVKKVCRLTSICAVFRHIIVVCFKATSLTHLDHILSFPSMPISQHGSENTLSLKKHQLTTYPPDIVHSFASKLEKFL